MCNPYDHSQDGLYEAKHQCGIKNGVKFITKEDYNQYMEYFNLHYKKENFRIDE